MRQLCLGEDATEKGLEKKQLASLRASTLKQKQKTQQQQEIKFKIKMSGMTRGAEEEEKKREASVNKVGNELPVDEVMTAPGDK